VARRYITRETGGHPSLAVEDQQRTVATVALRFGGEYWLVDAFGVRAGVDRIGEDGFSGASPAAGFAVRHTLGEISARIDYTALLEPYGLGVMHMVAVHIDL
jgi:hypothetical protein